MFTFALKAAKLAVPRELRLTIDDEALQSGLVPETSLLLVLVQARLEASTAAAAVAAADTQIEETINSFEEAVALILIIDLACLRTLKLTTQLNCATVSWCLTGRPDRRDIFWPWSSTGRARLLKVDRISGPAERPADQPSL